MGRIYSIIHVDDNKEYLEFAKSKLEYLSGDIFVASIDSSAAALEMMEEVEFDLVLSDYDMPEMNGIELLKEIRKRGSDIPFILLTGQGNEEIAAEALRLGADDYYTKDTGFVLFTRLNHSIENAINKRKLANEKMLLSERYHNLFKEMPQVVLELDEESRVIRVNPAIYNFLGVVPSKMISKSIIQYIHEDDRCKAHELLNNRKYLLSSRDSKTKSEIRFKDTAGNICCGLVQTIPVASRDLYQKMSPVGIQVIISDITEMKNAQRYERFLADVLRYSHDAIITINPQRKMTSFNRGAELLLQYKEKEAMGKHISLIIPNKTMTIVRKLLRSVTQMDQGRMQDMELKRKDGTSIWVDVIVTPIRDEKGIVTGFSGFLRDVTEQKFSEQSLRESEARYRSLFESNADGIYLMSYRFLDCNHKACEIWDCGREDIIGAHPAEFSPVKQPDGQSSSTKANSLIRAALKGKPQTFYWQHKSKNGKLIDCEVSLKRVKIAQKYLLLATVRDITSSLATLKALEASEEKYKNIIDNTQTGICIIQDKKVAISNKRLLSIFNIKEKDLEGFEIWSYIHSDDRQAVKSRISRLSKTRIPEIHINCRGKTADEIIKYLEIHASCGQYNKKPAIYMSIIDVTEQKEKEKDFISYQEELSRFIDNLPFPAFELDSQGNVTYLNEACERLYRIQKSDLIGKTMFRLFDSIDAGRIKEIFKSAKEGGESNIEIKLKKHETICEFRMVPRYDRHGNIIGVFGLANDITEKKKAELELDESRRKYHSLVEGALEGIIVTDPDDVINYSNSAFAKMLGYSLESVTGSHIARYVLGECLPIIQKETLKRRKGLSSSYTVTMIKNDGNKILANLSVSPMKDDKGRYQGSIAVIRDVTRTHKMASELQKSNRRLSVLQEIISISRRANTLSSMLNKALTICMKRMVLDTGAVYLVDRASKILFLKAFKGFEIIECNEPPEKVNISKIVSISRAPIFRYGGNFPVPFPDNTFSVILPMNIRDENIGIISFHKHDIHKDPFDEEEKSTLKSIAEAVSDGIKLFLDQEELKQIAENYKRLFDQNTAATFILDTNFNFLDCNPAAEKLFGFTRNELLTKNAVDFMHNEKEIRSAKRYLLTGRKIIDYKQEIFTKNGRILRVINNLFPIRNSQGEIIGFQSMLVDRTEKIEHEEHLNYLNDLRYSINMLSEQLYTEHTLEDKIKKVLQSTVDSLDADRVDVWLKRETVNQLNLTVEQINKDSEVLLSGSYSNSIEVRYNLDKLKTRRSQPSIMQIINDDLQNIIINEKHWKLDPYNLDDIVKSGIRSAAIFKIPDSHGNPVGALVILKKEYLRIETAEIYKSLADMIGRVVVENISMRILHESLDNFRYLYENANVGIFRTKITDGTFISANPTAAKLHGYNSVEELIAKCKASEIYPRDRREQLLMMLEQHGEVNGFEVRIKKRSGSEIDLLLNARLIKEKGYIEGTLTDINKLKKLEEELKHKNEEMEAFIYSVSHDLKSPIYTISGFVELLKTEGLEAEKQQDFFNRIHQNLQEMSIFISGLLDLSRAGKVVGDFREVEIESMVDKIFNELEVSYKHVELVHKNLPKSIIANTRIEEVFQNLIVNALQAKKDSGFLKLLVSCSERDDSWEFTVKDNGTGIDSTIKGQIFNPGFSTKGLREKGSGFGLSITKRIIEAHRGTISFTSQPDKGTTFKFVIPKLKESSENPRSGPEI